MNYKIYIIIAFTIAVLISGCNRRITINQNNIVNRDYIIKTQRLELLLNDTTIQKHVCIRPNGLFFLTDSLDTYELFSILTSKSENGFYENHIEKFEPINNDTLKLKSYFQNFIEHDSSIISHYGSFEFEKYNFIYEAEYSIILNNLKLNKIGNNSVRIIQPLNYDILSETPVIYSTIQLNFNEPLGLLIYSEGYYDSLANFIISRKDSCTINVKRTEKIANYLKGVNYNKEYYFTEIGLEVSEAFLIEINIDNKYYIFERVLYNEYNKKQQFIGTYLNLLYLKSKYL